MLSMCVWDDKSSYLGGRETEVLWKPQFVLRRRIRRVALFAHTVGSNLGENQLGGSSRNICHRRDHDAYDSHLPGPAGGRRQYGE